jgi:predicted dehydrogenase
MIATCADNDVKLWVAFYRRKLPRFLKIKELIESKAIGEVISVHTALERLPLPVTTNTPWRIQPEISGGGLFLDLGSHTLDLLDYFLGPIKEVRGFAVNQDSSSPVEDQIAMSFIFESGAVGTGNWCFHAGQEHDRTELVGTRGKIIFGTFDNEPVRLINEQGEQQFEIEHPLHIQQPLIQSIVNEMNGEGICTSTGVSGARTTWVIDQVLAEFRRKSPHIYDPL